MEALFIRKCNKTPPGEYFANLKQDYVIDDLGIRDVEREHEGLVPDRRVR